MSKVDVSLWFAGKENEDGSFANATASRLCNVTVSACDHGGAEGFDENATTCPYCGATTTPDASGCCEYCGGAVNAEPSIKRRFRKKDLKMRSM